MEYYSAIKKKWNCVIYREVDGPRDCHTEWSESDVEIQMLHDITYMWNLKKKWYKWTYLQNRNIQISKTNLMVTKGEMWGEEG